MHWGCCKAETFKQTWHNIIILCFSDNIPVKFQSTKITVSKKDDLLMRGSILPVTIPPRAHPRAFVYLTSYSPPPGTQKETIPHPRTKNKLLRFDDLFLYLNKTRNLKNHKLLEQLTPFRSKANIIKLDTHTNTPGGRFNQTASKIEMYLYKTTLKFLETI